MKTALITGASGAIGAETGRALARAGYAIALHYHKNKETAEDLMRELGALPPVGNADFPPRGGGHNGGRPALCVQANLADGAEVARMIATVEERLGTVSVLVNNAGVALPQALFTDCDAADYDRVFDVNVRGAMLVSRAVIPAMVRRGQGAIVNISSVFGVTGGSCEVIYSASKAAVIGFTKALAKELAPAGITVNCVAPGFVPSAMNAHLASEDVETIRLETPLQRLGTPADIAQAVAYLARAPFVTGQVLGVDGGAGI
ncbi:MAG: SDR family oxidoreductase [Clostridiales bacterium]|nr:SDR family oxidoreductase [Clostridiales bacterium]